MDKKTERETSAAVEVITAALRETWHCGNFVDGDSKKPYSHFTWSFYNKHGAEIQITFCVESHSVEILTIDSPRDDGLGFHFFDPAKSKRIQRLAVALLIHGIPATIDYGFRREDD